MGNSEMPLKGIKVLDLTMSYAGPFCTMLLSDMGADVVKVEPPARGDDSRHWGPPFTEQGESPWFLSVNRNKRSITLDINQADDRATLQKLIKKADVFVLSLGLKTLQKYDLIYEKVKQHNPSIIYCSITGFGQSGPYKNRPCYDLISEGIGGIMSVTGRDNEPEKVGTAAGDILAAHNACFAIVCCLYRRTFTGEGEYIDANLVESVMSFITPRIVSYMSTGVLPVPDSNRSTPIALYQPLRTKDGYLNVAIGNDKIWERVCKLLGFEEFLELDAYKTNADRREHRLEIIESFEKVLMTQDAQYWFEYLSEKGVPCGPIYYINQLVEDPHVKHRKTVYHIQSNEGGEVPQVRAPWKLGETRESSPRVPPRLGEHNREVYEEWLSGSGQRLHKEE